MKLWYNAEALACCKCCACYDAFFQRDGKLYAVTHHSTTFAVPSRTFLPSSPSPSPLPLQVIAYMTLGIDVSRLFPDMIMACNTKDLVVKK